MRGYARMLAWLREASVLVGSTVATVCLGLEGTVQTLDLGTAATGETLRLSLTNRNPTADVESIRRVESSCECIRVLSYPATIEAYGTAAIEVDVTGEKPGAYRYELGVVKARGNGLVTNVYAVDLNVHPAPQDRIPKAGWASGAALPPRELRRRDPSFYVAADEAEGAVLVDVRPEEAFATAHIPGSANAPLYALKAKSCWKNARVVLVDGGGGSPALERECLRLGTRGWTSVHVLEGGMCAWRRQGRAVEGRDPNSDTLASIRPDEWLAVRGCDDWIVVDVAADVSGGLVPEAVPAGGADLAAKVRELVLAAGRPCRVAVIGDGGARDRASRRQLAGVVDAPVFFLEGGKPGLEAYLQLRNALAAGSGRGRVGTAGAAAGKPGRRPCGSCP